MIYNIHFLWPKDVLPVKKVIVCPASDLSEAKESAINLILNHNFDTKPIRFEIFEDDTFLYGENLK